MTVKCVCTVDALYEYRSFFGKHQGRDIVTIIIGFILLVVKILYLIDWVVVLQLTGIEG